MWTRLAGALLVALGNVAVPAWRAARELFHETVGALFLLFAALGAASAWREWRRGSAEWLIALGIVFALLMGAFAAASFRSAWRLRKAPRL